MTEQIEEEAPDVFKVRVLERLDPARADLTVTSLDKFLKLLQRHDFHIQVQATRVYTEPTFYMSKSKDHNIGDLKKDGFEMECVFIQAAYEQDFKMELYVQASWYGGVFGGANISGPKSGRPWYEQLFKQITKAREEVIRCLS